MDMKDGDERDQQSAAGPVEFPDWKVHERTSESVAAKDDSTVVFSLVKPDITFIDHLITLGIVPKHLYGPDYGRHPEGYFFEILGGEYN